MAQLIRTVKMNDSAQTQSFLFQLSIDYFSAVSSSECDQPHSSTTEALSRELLYAGLKWKLSVVQNRRHLSPCLKCLCSGSLCATVDFRIELLNADSFTKNESFSERQAQFQPGEDSRAQSTFISVDECITRRFVHRNQQLLVELTLRNPSVVCKQLLQLNKPSQGPRSDEKLDFQQYQGDEFCFGGDFTWRAVFCPHMDFDHSIDAHRHCVQLLRKTKSDMLCRIRYRISVGGDSCSSASITSPLLEEIVGFDGMATPWFFCGDYFQYAKNYRMPLKIELLAHSQLSIVNVKPFSSANPVLLRDVDKQTWRIRAFQDERGGCISATFTYADIGKLPRDYLRYIRCQLRLTVDSGHAAVAASNGPFEHYFSKLDQESGCSLHFPVDLGKVRKHPAAAAHDQPVSIEVEWLDNLLLLRANYNTNDDVCMRHMHQMRREIEALQSENCQLERELHQYHLSLVADKQRQSQLLHNEQNGVSGGRDSSDIGEPASGDSSNSRSRRALLPSIPSEVQRRSSRDRPARTQQPAGKCERGSLPENIFLFDDRRSSLDSSNSRHHCGVVDSVAEESEELCPPRPKLFVDNALGRHSFRIKRHLELSDSHQPKTASFVHRSASFGRDRSGVPCRPSSVTDSRRAHDVQRSLSTRGYHSDRDQNRGVDC